MSALRKIRIPPSWGWTLRWRKLQSRVELSGAAAFYFSSLLEAVQPQTADGRVKPLKLSAQLEGFSCVRCTCEDNAGKLKSYMRDLGEFVSFDSGRNFYLKKGI